jgi:hypothetical protein
MGGVFNLVNLHLYHYAGNNPVKYTDPDGNDFTSFIFDIFIGLMNGNMPSSEAFNSAFPSNNPGFAAYAAKNHAKSDQSENPRTVDESLKAGYKPLPPDQAAWHRQGRGSEYNIKMVHPDGREAVYNKDGNLVYDPRNLGTRNDYPAEDMGNHFTSDVGPYLYFGNTPRDKPNGIIGAIFRPISGLITNLNTPKDYEQYWDRIYNPPNEQ